MILVLPHAMGIGLLYLQSEEESVCRSVSSSRLSGHPGLDLDIPGLMNGLARFRSCSWGLWSYTVTSWSLNLHHHPPLLARLPPPVIVMKISVLSTDHPLPCINLLFILCLSLSLPFCLPPWNYCFLWKRVFFVYVNGIFWCDSHNCLDFRWMWIL